MGCLLHAECQDQKSYHWNKQFLLAVIHIQDTVWLMLVAGDICSNVLVFNPNKHTEQTPPPPLLEQNMVHTDGTYVCT